MLSFHRLREIMAEVDSQSDIGDNDGPLLTSDSESVSMRVIRSGQNIRKPDCGNFWEDFMNVCSDADGMSELLGVPREKVASWNSKIREQLDKVKQTDRQDKSQKKAIVPTGAGLAGQTDSGELNPSVVQGPLPSGPKQ